MNKVILMGRLTRDPEVRYSVQVTIQWQSQDIHWLLTEDSRDGEATADFIGCSFGRSAEFGLKYFVRD